MGKFDLNWLDFIPKFIQLSQDPSENEYSLSYYAPKFIWLIKDFDIRDRDENGNLLTPNLYLEQSIK